MATEVTLDELADVIDRGGFVLDVREDHEWQEGHVPNAHHIPMNDVAENLDKLDDGARIFIICRSGGRSMTVANYLEAQGYDVVSVAGGTDGWANSGRDLSFEASLQGRKYSRLSNLNQHGNCNEVAVGVECPLAL